MASVTPIPLSAEARRRKTIGRARIASLAKALQERITAVSRFAQSVHARDRVSAVEERGTCTLLMFVDAALDKNSRHQ